MLCFSNGFSYVFLARRSCLFLTRKGFVIVERGRVVTCLCLVTSSLDCEK